MGKNNTFRNVVIAGAKRTPIGSFLGSISTVPAVELGAEAIKGAVEQAKISGDKVDEVIMGNVISAGLGQAPARQAAIYSGLPVSVECLTVNKMCGSGLKAVLLGSNAIRVDEAEIVVAGGMENMSLAPYLIPNLRKGLRLGHNQIQDSVIKDGLWDVYNQKHMGSCAETCARTYRFSRRDQDDFAKASYRKAIYAQSNGLFSEEIVPVTIQKRKGAVEKVIEDDEPKRVNFDKMSQLKPAFENNGTITAANASKINDGASAVVLLDELKAEELGIKPLVRILTHASFAQEPEWFTTAPVGAIKKVLKSADLSISDIDLFEINEAFSTVALATMKELKIPYEKMNIKGGAVALGHPIGASGARILTTLIYALKSQEAKIGLAAICIGGGEASAIIVENI